MKSNEVNNSMNIINNQIKEGTFSKVYLFYGSEAYIKKLYKNRLTDALTDRNDTMNYTEFKESKTGTDIIRENAFTLPFFAERRVIVVEGSGYFKSGGDALADIIPELPDTTVIIFYENDVDKRCRLYKTVQKYGSALCFDTPDEQTFLRWIKKLFTDDGLTIDDIAVFKLLEVSQHDMYTAFNNAEKVKCYCLERGHVTENDVLSLCEDHVEDKIFEMTDAISMHNKSKALNLYNDLLTLGESPDRILPMISRHYNILCQVRLMTDQGEQSEIARTVGIPPFTVKKYSYQCKDYTLQELTKKADSCQETVYGIRSGRLPDKKTALEMLILNLLK